jgi:protein-S-isoprenylcysteine O-methyltransferase Ste14
MTKFMDRLFVWAGGGMFVGSLGYCAYSYLFRWSGGGAGGGWPACGFNAMLLSVFATHHSLFARDPVKQWLARHLPEPRLRSLYVWTAALLLLAACGFWRPIGGDLYDAGGWTSALHIAVQLAGLWLIARAVGTIDPLELAGIRRLRRTPAASDARETAGQAASERLQVGGPYRLVRHPLYFGWLLIVFGAPHLTGDRVAFAAITTLYLVLAIPWEERSLTAEFGKEYERYKRRVRWKLVPYVY